MNFYKDTSPTVLTNDGDKVRMNDIAVNSKVIPELVDNGRKNLLDLRNCTFASSDGLSYKISDSDEITVSTTSSSSLARSVLIDNINLPVNTKLVLSGCPENGSVGSYLMDVICDGLQIAGSIDAGTGSSGFILSSDQTTYIRIRIAANYTMSNKVFKVMVCTKEAWDVSQKFVPYKHKSIPLVYYNNNVKARSAYMEHTGLSCSFPANKIYRVTGSIVSNNNAVTKVQIRVDSYVVAENEPVGSNSTSVTAVAMVGPHSDNSTISLYGQWNGSSYNAAVLVVEEIG